MFSASSRQADYLTIYYDALALLRLRAVKVRLMFAAGIARKPYPFFARTCALTESPVSAHARIKARERRIAGEHHCR